MIIDTLVAIIILFNGSAISFDSFQSIIEPKTDTTIYAVIDNDTIYQKRKQTIEERDLELKEEFDGVGVNEIQRAIQYIQDQQIRVDELKNILNKTSTTAFDEMELKQIFSVHPDTIAIWTEEHNIETHSEQYREFNLK